jgi:hypothetical protein
VTDEQPPALQPEVVRAMLAAFPRARDALGPHGIPLIRHAEAGGEPAREVLELLQREAATV